MLNCSVLRLSVALPTGIINVLINISADDDDDVKEVVEAFD